MSQDYSNLPPIWQAEIKAGSVFGQRVIRAIGANPQLNRAAKRVPVPSVSKIGTHILNAFELALGRRIGCETCRGLLLSYNQTASIDIEEVVGAIYRTSLEIPETICERNANSQRGWIRGVIESVYTPKADMEITKPNRGMTQSELAIQLLSLPTDTWPQGWKDWPNVVEYHKGLVREAVEVAKSSKPVPLGINPRRAVLIPAGGYCRIYDRTNPQPYFWAAYAAAWVLRSLGCTLPIEFWFLPGEMEGIDHCELHARRVAASCHVVNIEGLRVVHGWQVKIHAILQSSADQVLHLDSDNIVARNPTFLFDSVEFNKNAALFWGDNPNLKDHRGYVNPKQWERLGCDRRDTVRDIEAGQMLIDKRRGAAALQVVRHLAEHADYWGGFNGGEPGVWYGDKTDFHVGFALTETPYWVNQGFKWNTGGFYEHTGTDGKLLFQHACHKKGNLVNGHAIQNLKGNSLIWEAHRFRSPHAWLNGSVKDATRSISPEKIFAIPSDAGVSREVWMDVLGRNEYRLPQSFQPGEVVIDIGANSGAFSYAALRRGANVVACEPFQESVSRLRFNCAEFDAAKLTVIEAAVWRSDEPDGVVSLSAHEKDARTTSFSVVIRPNTKSSVAVPTISLDSLLQRYDNVHILKLDCEGSEFPILYTAKELGRCEYIIGEYHSDANPSTAGGIPVGGWPEWSLTGLQKFLSEQGFEVSVEKTSDVLGLFWARRTKVLK